MKSLTFQFKTLVIKKVYKQSGRFQLSCNFKTLLSVWLLHYAVLTEQVTYSEDCDVRWPVKEREETAGFIWRGWTRKIRKETVVTCLKVGQLSNHLLRLFEDYKYIEGDIKIRTEFLTRDFPNTKVMC